jgi:hypothetical protein
MRPSSALVVVTIAVALSGCATRILGSLDVRFGPRREGGLIAAGGAAEVGLGALMVLAAGVIEPEPPSSPGSWGEAGPAARGAGQALALAGIGAVIAVIGGIDLLAGAVQSASGRRWVARSDD